MKLLSPTLPFTILLLSPFAAAFPLGDGACPSTGYCHLPRWAPDDLSSNAHLGSAVDIEGDTAVVGAPEDGAVYVYHRDGGQWVFVQRLELAGYPDAGFGESLYLDGDELVIGAPYMDIFSGVLQPAAGAVYVYERAGLVWSLANTLTHEAPSSSAYFGTSVAKQGDRILVGAPNVEGPFFGDIGAAVLFERNGFGWSQETQFMTWLADDLGMSVAIDGSRIIAGDSNADTLGLNAGEVYAWHENGDAWDYEILNPPGIGASAHFGTSLSASDGWLAIGAPQADAPGAGLSGGAVFLYRWDEATKTHEYKTTLYECEATWGWFGRSVDLEGDRLVVGAPYDDTTSDGQAGRAHVYEFTTFPYDSWVLKTIVEASDGLIDDRFGWGVGVDGDFVLAGATGVGPEFLSEGAAYLVSLQSQFLPGGDCPCDVLATAETYGTGKPGSFGVPVLELTSTPVIGESVVVRIEDGLVGAQPFIVWGLTAATIPFDGGELYVGDPHLILMPTVSLLGTSGAGWDVPNDPAICGTEFALQTMFLDPGAGGPFHTAQSKGLAATIGY